MRLRRYLLSSSMSTLQLSQRWCFYQPSERDKKVGPVPLATAGGTDQGTDVLLFPKGIWTGPCYWPLCSLLPSYCKIIPTRTSSRPLIGIFKYTSSFATKGTNRHGQDILMLMMLEWEWTMPNWSWMVSKQSGMEVNNAWMVLSELNRVSWT